MLHPSNLSYEPLIPVLLNETLDGLISDVLGRTVRHQLVPEPLLHGRPPDRRFGRVEDHVSVSESKSGSGVDVFRLFVQQPTVASHLVAVRKIKTRTSLESFFRFNNNY